MCWTSKHYFAFHHLLGMVFFIVSQSDGFYVPGVAPVEFKEGDFIEVKAVKMTSTLTQLPYEYYSLPFCRPKKGDIIYKTENLGEVLRGDRIVNTPYEVQMTVNQYCRVLCNNAKTPLNWSFAESKLVASRIQHQYYVHLLIDNLPCGTRINTQEDSLYGVYEHGYKLGFVENGKPYINNHLKLLLKYHTQPGENFRVVGFEVIPQSIDISNLEFTGDKCRYPNLPNKQVINVEGPTKLHFTYEVSWEESNIRWASRWDIYLKMKDIQIHWFSTLRSVVIVFFLSGLLAIIIIRTLRRDIAHYNKDKDLEDTFEETGWKLLHGDVFRPPNYPELFAAVIGSGIQIFLMAFITMSFAVFGMLSPASRGALMTAAILLYAFMGCVSGYFSSRIYKTIRGVQWKRAALCTATLFPGIVFITCFFLNFFIWGKQSSGAVPFTTMLALVCLWFGVSLPLVFIGYYFGIKKNPYEHPVRTNQIPRQVPEAEWNFCMNPIISTLIAGVLPFIAMYVELYFILTAIWQNQFYYLFGFLFLVFIVLIISVSQISIVMVYFQLRNEDYRWWWKSVVASGSSAVFVFGHSIVYFITELKITEFIPTLLYFGYTALIALTFWVLTGTIGFYAAYFFLRKIYSVVKID